ncbi:PilX N-terminal domain-containing pilus assembly protein [Herbaspirillum sp. NPDC087042]|uniref:PilX N-terminal domain-containing pilus assembly protein n=1 Tax=Herbaspirillum sp. NPDC087042 TaxID=3364004 RepID=UPI003816723A
MSASLMRQRGATLMIALCLLSVILLLGAASTSLLMLDEHAARNHREHVQAHLAAQAALADACDDLMRVRRVTLERFDARTGCLHPPESRGLCLGKAAHSGWQPAQLHGPQAMTAAYGEFTGRRFGGAPDIPTPRYLIERLLPARKAAASAPTLYRLHGIGYGRGEAMVALQAVVAWPDADSDAADPSVPSVPSRPAQCPLLAWRPLFLPATQ